MSLERFIAVNRWEWQILQSPSASRRSWFIARAGDLLGEFLGSFFVGMCGLTAASVAGSIFGAASAFGMSAASMHASIGLITKLSPGMFNSTIAWAICLLGYASCLQTLFILLSQLLGYMGAAGFVRFVLPARANIAVTVPTAPLDVQTHMYAKLFLCEYLTSMCSAAAVILVTREVARASKSLPLRILSSIMAGIILCAAIATGDAVGTGGSINFARSLGPAIVFNNYNSLGVYFCASFFGGISAAMLIALADYVSMRSAIAHALQAVVTERVDERQTREMEAELRYLTEGDSGSGGGGSGGDSGSSTMLRGIDE